MIAELMATEEKGDQEVLFPDHTRVKPGRGCCGSSMKGRSSALPASIRASSCMDALMSESGTIGPLGRISPVDGLST
jgi:hypothetical protein